jgi:hypothetical protein
MLKGTKASLNVLNLIKDLHTLRGGDTCSKLFLRKSHDMHPFENIGYLE